ncbi:DUF4190 domain-containing protein [Streptomyces sp. NPDC006274]|uniref:DUF4190 domain-containing protein n=1 Tax=unclassified Streptomyces TaxID=2593676 RepID=UPI0033A58FDA
MSDNQVQPPGGPQPHDPWAPPENSSAAGGVPLDKPAATPPPSVHDQQTVISMPGADGTGSVPPPPVAPGGPAPAQPPAGAYGYPAAPGMPQPPAAGGYGVPDPYGAGYPGYPGYGQTAGWQQQPANGMGITAMVLGILAVTIGWCYGIPALILGTLALIFGILGRKRAKRGEANNGGMALAGIIMGAIGLVIFLLFAVGIGLFIANVDKLEDDYNEDSYNDDPFRSSLVVDVTR